MHSPANFFSRIASLISIILLSLTALISFGQPASGAAPSATQLPSVRTVNMPYINSSSIINDHLSEMAIFWFGKVTNIENYTDVRIAYNDQAIIIKANVFDRYFRYDTTGNPAKLTKNDAVMIYLNTGSLSSTTVSDKTYRFTGGLNWWEDHSQYQAGNQGTKGTWNSLSSSFSTLQGYAGANFNNGKDNRGYAITFTIPFSSLGLSSKPPDGTVWGLSAAVYDRDGSAPGPTKIWPETFSASKPSTWGHLYFGSPSYNPPATNGTTELTIRNKLNGVSVVDAGVGGDINNLCNATSPWTKWGTRNFKGQTGVNIQNQDYIGDWPCFSRFYINFPLTKIPAGKVIVSAKLIMYEWGGSDPTQAQPSLIQVFSLKNDWAESTINWNNAPMALENVSQTWVNPFSGSIVWPGASYKWDVSRAVAQAYGSRKPLRLALYSADGPFHSGKYFSTSNAADWDAAGRPTLVVTWGNAQ